MYDNQVFKTYFSEKRYDECIQLLKNKIINFILFQIQEIDKSIEFTTVSDLITASDFYLKNSSVARHLEIALRKDKPLDQIEILLDICEIHNIK